MTEPQIDAKDETTEDVEEQEDEVEALAQRRGRRNRNEKSSRLSALELLKKCKAEGKKHAFEVGEVENLYEVVTEEEYSSRVQGRIESNFVVGSGYDDDGREVFDEDYDYNSDDDSKRPGDRKVKKRKGNDVEKGAKDGEGGARKKMKCIDDVFRSIGSSNAVKAKESKVKIDDDDILGDILKEIKADTSGGATGEKDAKSVHSLRLLDTSSKSSYWNTSGASLLPSSAKSFLQTKSHSRLNKFATKQAPVETAPDVLVPESQEFVTMKDEPESVPTIGETYDDSAEDHDEDEEENTSAALLEGFDFDDNLVDPNVDTGKAKSKNEDEIPDDDLASDGIDWASLFEDSTQDSISSSQAKTMKFFWLDAYEDAYKNPEFLFLFGKVFCEKTGKLKSCCLRVTGLERILFLLPRETRKSDPDQAVTTKDLYLEFDKLAEKLRILKFKSRVVNKKYCFEISDVPVESDYLEVRYSCKFPEVTQLEGDTFCKIFGAKTSALENLLLHKNIYGPCWLEIKAKNDINPVSWCDMNMTCEGVNCIKVFEKTAPAPSVTAVSISTCVSFNSQTNTNEVVGVALLVNKSMSLTNTVQPIAQNAKGGKEVQAKIWHEHHFGIAKPKDSIFPYNFEKNVSSKIKNVAVLPNEKSLLNWFVCKCKLIDADIIIGHDLLSFQLDLIVNRLMFHKVPHWSRISRLKRTYPPKSMNGNVIPSLTAGRLICDVTVSAKELVRCRGYSLTDLALQILHEDRQQIDLGEVSNFYSSNDTLMQLIALTLNDASYCIRIANELQSIPLAIQITNIAGNVASRTFTGGRAERNEFLLLHAFHEKGYVVPDKSFKKGQAQQHFIEQELVTQGDEENAPPGGNNADGSGSRKRKAAYAGGLVLEPKKGFYNTCILLLDFNSLYPSIMQEYNICYTTVNRSHCYAAESQKGEAAGEEPVLPDVPDVGLKVGILPTEIRKLVDKRKQVKLLLKQPNLTAELKAQYDIRQKGLKLTANSMYGCLGFPNSRFYAKPLAALITAKGREILMKTKELVESMGHDVIYGDTDSIMVNSNIENMAEVFKIGGKIKNEVNKYYKTLEIDIDGVYKCLLLLKKKKYAALAVTSLPNGEYKYEKELKGLDIVRRDWSILAREAGEFVIGEILSNKTREDIVCNIQQYLTDLASNIENGKVDLEKFIIRKTLNKAPECYPDKRSLPHVQVAARLNSKGGKKLQGGDTVPYVVCKDGSELSATQRGYSPEELEKSGGKLAIDRTYYYSQQLHPVIARICEPIDEISSASIAQCLGLDPAQYAVKEQTQITELDEPDLQTRFQHCVPFKFKCPKCKTPSCVSNAFNETSGNLALFECEKCKYHLFESRGPITNALLLQLRSFVNEYYANMYYCEDCDFKTRSIPFKFVGRHPLCPQCKKHALSRRVSEADLYNQLTYLSYVFDPARALMNMPEDNKLKANLAMRNGAQSKALYMVLKEQVDAMLKQSAFSAVNMSSLFRPLATYNFAF